MSNDSLALCDLILDTLEPDTLALCAHNVWDLETLYEPTEVFSRKDVLGD